MGLPEAAPAFLSWQALRVPPTLRGPVRSPGPAFREESEGAKEVWAWPECRVTVSSLHGLGARLGQTQNNREENRAHRPLRQGLGAPRSGGGRPTWCPVREEQRAGGKALSGGLGAGPDERLGGQVGCRMWKALRVFSHLPPVTWPGRSNTMRCGLK